VRNNESLIRAWQREERGGRLQRWQRSNHYTRAGFHVSTKRRENNGSGVWPHSDAIHRNREQEGKLGVGKMGGSYGLDFEYAEVRCCRSC
jgi:hypothetical protein